MIQIAMEILVITNKVVNIGFGGLVNMEQLSWLTMIVISPIFTLKESINPKLHHFSFTTPVSRLYQLVNQFGYFALAELHSG